MAPKKLTARQRAFILEYCRTFNATQAAIAAGYSKKTARATGHENVTKRYIREAIEATFAALQPTQDELKRALRLGRQNRSSNWVYLIREEWNGLVKIGCAIDPLARLKHFQVSVPQRLDLIAAQECDDAIAIEAALHTRYEAKHYRGEWFRLTEDDIQEVKDEWERKSQISGESLRSSMQAASTRRKPLGVPDTGIQTN